MAIWIAPAATAMEAAIAALPEEKKQFFLGYAEGVAAMADQIKDKKLA